MFSFENINNVSLLEILNIDESLLCAMIKWTLPISDDFPNVKANNLYETTRYNDYIHYIDIDNY